MPKIFKRLFIIIISIIVIWAVYVLIDCIRLRVMPAYTKPTIIIEEKENKSTITYYGIGYSITYDKPSIFGKDYALVSKNTEFKVLDLFVVWKDKK